MSELAAVEEVPVRLDASATPVVVVQTEGCRPVLAAGGGAVSTFLTEPGTVEIRPPHADPPQPEHLRALFKALFARGERYQAAGAE
jgi:hypothetical protein